MRPIVDEQYIIPKTIEFIKRNAAAKKPFFVYVGYSEVHPPVIGNPNFVGKSTERGGLFADVIAEMDYRVGQILDAVKEAGVEDNTIFILSSDNAGGGVIPQTGPVERTLARRFLQHAVRGQHAGASHGPLARQGPGRCRHRTDARCGGLAAHAGRDGGCVNLVPKDRPIDGIDASAFMLGKRETTGRDSYMFFGIDGELMSIKWKIYKTIFRYSEKSRHP